mmetsp:Transcript_9839/g.23343  ORF Transcript_9839/g.23343 Transcript_9839/m.23343 type:complete len:298 (+) Transcript_9839:529-1422(+)
MLRSWKLRPAFAKDTHGRSANSEDQTPLMACQASRSLNSFASLSSPSRSATSFIAKFSASFSALGKRMDSTSCCASSKMTCASSFEVDGCRRLRTFSSIGRTSLLQSSVSDFCMVPYGNATACGVRIPGGSFGRRRARFKLLEPTLDLVISSGRTHQEHPRSLVKFILTSASATLAASASAFALSSSSVLLGLSTSAMVSVPSGLHLTSTHLSAKSDASFSEIFGSKHVARSTPKFLARTAQCERMSGASFALRTRTPRTPSGTSSSPLTAPLSRIVGVWKISPCTPIILSMSLKTP